MLQLFIIILILFVCLPLFEDLVFIDLNSFQENSVQQ